MELTPPKRRESDYLYSFIAMMMFPVTMVLFTMLDHSVINKMWWLVQLCMIPYFLVLYHKTKKQNDEFLKDIKPGEEIDYVSMQRQREWVPISGVILSVLAFIIRSTISYDPHIPFYLIIISIGVMLASISLFQYFSNKFLEEVNDFYGDDREEE